jgi:peptidoglycan/LPS O-acetylase OafA/YrhL
MRQAIEENFILDVLKGYVPYKTAFNLGKRIEDKKRVSRKQARKALARWMSLHPTNVTQKVQFIVEHLSKNVAHLLDGKAKAMAAGNRSVTLILLVSASILHDKITPKWWEFVIYKSLFVYNWFGTRQLDTFLQEMPLQGTGNHFWSINTEEQFYLFAPIPLVLVNKRFGQNLLIWVAIALIAWLTKDYASIALGVLAAVAVKQYGNFHETTKARVILFITAIASMVTMLLNDNLYAKVAPFCAVSIVLLLSIRGEKNHLGKFMGGISYPLYLNAWIGGFMANAFAKHIIAVAPNVKHGIAILLSFLIASTLYWFIERPMLNMRAKLYSGRLAKLVVLVGYLSIFAGIGFGLSHFS